MFEDLTEDGTVKELKIIKSLKLTRKNMIMAKLWKNWTVHNIICHPLAQIVYLIIRPFGANRADNVYALIHNSSLPEKDIWESW